MRLPTVKLMTSRGFKVEEAKQIRTVMERYERKHGIRLVRPTHTMAAIDKIMNGCGVEDIPQGHNDKSPAIMYVNMGDSYDTTVLFVRGEFKIGSWADIVERGKYD